MAEKTFEQLTLSEKVIIAESGFECIDATLVWSDSPIDAASIKKMKPYFFDRLNQILESLGIDCSSVKGVTMANYHDYTKAYKKLETIFYNKYIWGSNVSYYDQLPDEYVYYGDYLGECPQYSLYSDSEIML